MYQSVDGAFSHQWSFENAVVYPEVSLDRPNLMSICSQITMQMTERDFGFHGGVSEKAQPNFTFLGRRFHFRVCIRRHPACHLTRGLQEGHSRYDALSISLRSV